MVGSHESPNDAPPAFMMRCTISVLLNTSILLLVPNDAHNYFAFFFKCACPTSTLYDAPDLHIHLDLDLFNNNQVMIRRRCVCLSLAEVTAMLVATFGVPHHVAKFFALYICSEAAILAHSFPTAKVLALSINVLVGSSASSSNDSHDDYYDGLEQALSESAEESANHPGFVPATKASIDALKTIAISERCTICMEELVSPNEVIAMMPCSHFYHKNCIVKWLETSHICPLCRHAMPTLS